MPESKNQRAKTLVRWRQFAKAYIVDFNAHNAALAAGYSEKSALYQGSRLVNKDGVKQMIAEELENRNKRTAYDADRVKLRLEAEVDADLADLYDDAGELLPIKEWPLIWRQGLAQDVTVEMLQGGEEAASRVVKIKQGDRLRRLELLGKHANVNAFKEVTEVQHTGLSEALEAANERAATMRAKVLEES